MTRYLNQRQAVRLRKLATAGEIDDETMIHLYSAAGKPLMMGRWWEDSMLEYTGETGYATTRADGDGIDFRLEERP